MTQSDQLDYINAVKCLRSKPALTADTYEGAKSRYDDFQAVHIDNTDFIHWCVSRYHFGCLRAQVRL